MAFRVRIRGIAIRTKQEHTVDIDTVTSGRDPMFDDVRETFQDVAALGALLLLGATLLIWSDVLVEVLRA